ncbi:MAG: TolB family protein, partial [Panacagrimonas sp.]
MIGNYRSWGEILAVHELTHITHMSRPSRNPLQRALWGSLTAHLGPIMRKTPRWVFEGYATLIEGVITGSGRPNNVWRPAILRQWAIEGRLPTYDQLSFWDDYSGGGFAYLSGSAFLEWLSHREGDSSLVHVWRRLTARRVRSFDASFEGVYGDSPRLLYGRHAAELTRDAMLVKAELERAGLIEGEMIQHLAWGTGDPAISPDGERIALTVRERDRPPRVVVWKTGAEPEDTAAVRKRAEELKKDPEDVPARRFYPMPKRPVRTLLAANGRSYQNPRWFADNRRVILTRWVLRGDGTLAPDLFVWDTEGNDVRRTTYVGGVLQADPHPNGQEAVAMRCRRGHCDVVRVDLTRGTVQPLLEGTPERSYYRPRFSPDGDRFAASVSDNGHWRIVVADRNGANVRIIDPGDGTNRYDVQWLRTGDSLVVVSERGGIANLELLSIATASPRTLTRVTGAALAPDVQARDGSIWFLALHSRGFDVRRLSRSAHADSAIAITADRFGFAGLRTAAGMPLRTRAVPAARPYGGGPRYQRWYPGLAASGDGAGAFLSLLSGD